MALKPNLVKDILNIIAYGPSYTRVSASKLLFYYWPSFNTSLFERKAAPVEISNAQVYYFKKIVYSIYNADIFFSRSATLSVPK